MATKTKPKNQTKKIKKRWLSPTSINMYMRCPRRFYLRYVRKLKTSPNIHLLRGSCIHSVLEKYFKEGYADSSENVYYDQLRGAILCLFNDEWRTRKGSFVALDLKEDDIAFYFQDSQKMIINWLHSYLKSGEPPADPSETEVKIFSKKWRTMCIIDRILRNGNPPKIRDYKTSKSCEITDDNRRQMGICALLYEDKYGTKPDAEIHYLKFQDGLKNVNLTDEYMEDLKQLIIDVHHKTMSEREEDYPCKCNGYCDKEHGIA